MREEEGLRPSSERLFEDPYAHLFRGGQAAEEVLERFVRVPFFREGVRIRTRFIDDGVRDALAAGVDQVLIMGAGFDCRALRLPEIAERSASVFEVDFAEQLRAKREILERAGVRIPAYVRAVSCDFSAAAFADELQRDLTAAGFSTADRSCMIWEGVIGYLDAGSIDEGLRWLAHSGPPDSRLIFTYPAFRFSPESFTERVRAAGFTAVDDYGCGEIYRRYLGSEPPPGGDVFRLGHARV